MDDLLCRVLTACRGELTGLFPGLGAAFSFLPWQEDRRLGTDGQTLFVPRTLVNAYGRNPARVRRGYLHILLHCLFFRHLRLRLLFHSQTMLPSLKRMLPSYLKLF